jgi:hypothetical protein
MNLLDNGIERTFLLDFAYLVAVADGDVRDDERVGQLKGSWFRRSGLRPVAGLLETCARTLRNAWSDKQIENEFQDDFPMSENEVRAFSELLEEMEYDEWPPVRIDEHGQIAGVAPPGLFGSEKKLLNMMLAEIPEDMAGILALPPDTLRDAVFENSFPKQRDARATLALIVQIIHANNGWSSRNWRNIVLWQAFLRSLPEDTGSFPEKSRRIILFEAAAMAHVDKNRVSGEEDMLLQLFCRHFKVDTGWIEECKEIFREISGFYANSMNPSRRRARALGGQRGVPAIFHPSRR